MNFTERCKLMSEAFVTRKRDSGEEFVCLRDGSPEWMTGVVFEAHSSMPDDWTYRMIRDASDALRESGAEDASETDTAIDYLPDYIMTHERLDWLASDSGRIGAADEALESLGLRSIVDAIGYAMADEAREVLASVAQAIEDLCDDDDDDDNELEG